MASPLHILKISAGLPPQRAGGAPAYIADLRSGLEERGYRVTYLSSAPHDRSVPLPRITETAAGRADYAFHHTGATVPFLALAPSALADVTASPSVVKVFSEFLDNISPDLIHFHELLGVPLSLIEIASRRGIPTVFTSQDYFPACPTIQLYREGEGCCRRMAEQLVCAQCLRAKNWDRFSDWSRFLPQIRKVVPSARLSYRVAQALNLIQRSADQLTGTDARRYIRRRHFVRLYLAQLDVIVSMSKRHYQLLQTLIGPLPNMRQMYLSRRSYSTGTRPSERRMDGSGSLKFLALNLTSGVKGQDLLLAEFQRFSSAFPRCELHLYGGDAGTTLGNIHFHGSYRTEDLDSIVDAFDASIIPSIWEEPYGYVGPEMLSRGLPVIASNRGALPEYVHHGENGLLFDPDIPGSLEQALASFASDPGLRHRLKEKAMRPNPAILGFEEHLDQTEALYHELVRPPNPAKR